MPPVSTAASLPLLLSPFAPQTAGPVHALQAKVERSGAVLHFQFSLDADLSLVRIPERRLPAATNELWKHTCFEAFLMRLADEPTEYFELNLSPSTQWAVYAFDRYREGMASVPLAEPPDVRVEAGSSGLQLDARVNMGARIGDGRLRMALAAVIEDSDGSVSYWALKHAGTRPDFHHPAGFILEV